MNLLNKLRNKYFLAITTLALIVMASFGLFSFYNIDSVEAGMIKFDKETSVSISNSSFTSHSDSSIYPRPLNNYTTAGTQTLSLKSGAINVVKSTYASKYNEYGLTEDDNPYADPYIYDSRTDDYVLMINSQDSCKYGYISSDFTFKANGHYYVTVSVYTIGDAGIASVYLLEDGVVFGDCKLENISTSNSWCNYTFYVSTNSYEDVTLNFAMYLGGLNSRATGVVFFDDLHAGQIGESTLNEAVNGTEDHSTAYKYVDNRHDFESVAIDTHFSKNEGGAGEKTSLYKNNIMKLTANDSYVLYKGQEITLGANTTYRFSINVKVSEALKSGSAFVKLDEILDEDEVYDDFMGDSSSKLTAKNSKLTVSGVTSSTINDGWVEYVIYVRAGYIDDGEFKDSKVQFSFGLGDSSANATGSVSFKDFRIERVPYSAYSKASTGSTVGKMDISDRISLNSAQYSNHTFDKMSADIYEGVPYPATATDWTLTSGEGYQVSGIVNLANFSDVLAQNAGMNNVSTPSNWGETANNNVLMIYNGSKSTQSYTSGSKSLDANKYYRITTFVNATSTDNGATVLAKLKSGDNYSTILKFDEIVTNGEWQRVEFIIHTPGNGVDLCLELALGNGNKLSSGYAFFDNIMIHSADTIDGFNTQYNEYPLASKTVDGKTVYAKQNVDLTDSMQSLTTSKDYNEAMLYASKSISGGNVNAGIVNLENGLTSVISPAQEEALRNIDVNKILAISSVLNEDVYYTLTSLISYKFESGKYYEFSIDVFTDGINQVEKDEMHDNGVLAQGVGVELTGLENAKFSYIVSNGKWTTYKLYIGVDTACTSNLVLSMGSEFTGCYGNGFFGNIQLTEIDEDIFNAKTADSTTLVVNKVAEEDVDKDETEDKEKSPVNWANIITGLVTSLTFIAIVLAVMAYVFKRNVKFKKRVKGGRASYDRDITVMKSKYRRLATDQRDKEVRELTKECDELIALRTEYEEKYKEALNKVRSLKLSNRDGSKQHEISATEREVKHISKEVARYGMQINAYENEIEFMKTEGYLIDLEKRMMREDTSSRNQLRKEELMTEEERKVAIEKREQKLAKQKAKAESKAKKLAEKEALLQEEREQIELEKQAAVEKDAEFVKAQELKRVKAEEERLAKEKAKAEKELAKIKQDEEELKQESEELAKELEQEEAEAREAETSEDAEAVVTENSENAIDEVVETSAENTNNAESTSVESAENGVDTESAETVAENNQVETTVNAEVEEKSVENAETKIENTTEQTENNQDNN